jgi:VCBS repeat-containing protein
LLRHAAHLTTHNAAWHAALFAAALSFLIGSAAHAQQPPSFSSTPVTSAVQGQAYSYSITVTDPDPTDTIAITAGAPLPPWLGLTDNGNRTATLAGVPGPADVGDRAITLAASDGVNTVQQQFTITVAAETVPVAVADAYSTPQDTQLRVGRNQGVLANDEGSGPGPGGDLTAVLESTVTHGTLALQPDGSFNYTPAASYAGPDSFTYRAVRGPASSDPATVTITVNDTNDAPVSANDTYATAEDTQLTVALANGVLANDTDADGNTLTAQLVADVAHGTLALNANGSFIYMPDANFNGPDTFTYRANDGTENGNTATVTINVSTGNDPPVAVNDSYSTNQNTPLTVNAANGVLANDTDLEGDPLSTALVVNVTSGILLLSPNGSFVFTPAVGFSGNVSFTYQANDGSASSNTAMVTIAVAAVNGAPTAAPDAYTVAEDTPLTVAAATGVLANDTDPDAGTSLTAALGTAVTNGTLALAADGSFTYTPAPNFSGAVTFTYTASDGTAASAPATVTITVTPANDAPFFTNAPPTTATEGVTYSYTMAGSDPDGGAVLFAAPTLPAWLAFTPPATISGTPTQANVGAHDVVVTISDGVGPAVAMPFRITVGDVDDQPVIAPIPPQTGTEGVPFTLNLAQFVTDADTPAQSIAFAAAGALPAGLSLSPAGVLSGVPQVTSGAVTVAFTATDATPPAVSGQFSFTVLRAGRADLALALSAAPNPVTIGTSATWTFTVANQSPTVEVPSFTLAATFGGDVPFRFDAPSTPACTASAAGNDTQLACTLGPLAGGASTSVTIAGNAALAGDVFASATVAMNGPAPIDETAANNAATASLGVAQQIVGAPGQSIPGLSARAAAAGDLDGDGFDDLAVVTGSAQGLIVLANVADSSGTGKRLLSTAPVVLGGEAVGNDVAIADLDGDGDLDIVVAAGAGAPNRVYLADAGNYTSAALENAAAGRNAVAVGDVNGDGFVDLVFAGPTGSRVFVNSGSGGAFTGGALVGNRPARDVALVDLFGDSLPELVAANADGDAQVFRNSGGAFALELALPTGATTSVGTADFNGDGRVDLVFGRNAAPAPGARPSNLVWLNTSGASGDFFLADELGAAMTAGVTVDDVDLDGDADVLAVNGEGVAVYGNSGGGRFALRPQQLDTTAATSAVTGKLNGDDRDDVAVVADGGIAVYFNDGSGNFGSGDTAGPTISLVGAPTVSLKVGSAYTDAGATAADAVDGDVTSRIKVTNPVDTAVIGTYTVTYEATDLSGNAAVPVTRTVRVEAEQAAEGGGGGAVGLELALLSLLLLLKNRDGLIFRRRRAAGK